MTDAKIEHDKNTFIDVHEPWNLNYWCEELSLRAEELKEIVRRVGPLAMDVRQYMARKWLASWPSYLSSF